MKKTGQRPYENVEDSAKTAGLGLWADPVAPWDWRKANR